MLNYMALYTHTVYSYCIYIHTVYTYTVYSYCIHILYTHTVYTYCIFILYTHTVYTYCIFILYTHTVYTYCIHILYVRFVLHTYCSIVFLLCVLHFINVTWWLTCGAYSLTCNHAFTLNTIHVCYGRLYRLVEWFVCGEALLWSYPMHVFPLTSSFHIMIIAARPVTCRPSWPMSMQRWVNSRTNWRTYNNVVMPELRSSNA